MQFLFVDCITETADSSLMDFWWARSVVYILVAAGLFLLCLSAFGWRRK